MIIGQRVEYVENYGRVIGAPKEYYTEYKTGTIMDWRESGPHGPYAIVKTRDGHIRCVLPSVIQVLGDSEEGREGQVFE